MTYSLKESSVSEGSPYFLYEFNTADTVYRYADLPDDFTWNTLDWESFPISHSEIKQSSDMSKNGVSVTIPIKGELASLFVGWSPDHIVTLTIRRGHIGEDETLVYWKGRVSSHTLKNMNIVLNCESIFTSLRRPGVRARFQRNCRHAVYTRGCGAVKEDFAVGGIVEAVSGRELTVLGAETKPNGWFLGGIIELPDGSFRWIVGHTGTLITISRASRIVLEGFASSGYGLGYGQYYGGFDVTLYPGCNRTIEECLNKFDNLDNQGGFKWIPTKNPMGGSSII